jgi:hypothetical protein
VRVDLLQPYARTGIHPVQLSGDARCLHWFANGTLDYVYSSHLLEDFEDTKSIIIGATEAVKTEQSRIRALNSL